MRMMFGLVLVVGLTLAGIAVYMVNGYFSQTQEALKQERELREKTGPLVQVYVMKEPVGYGEAILPEDVATVYWQENSLPEGVFRMEGPEEVSVLFPKGDEIPRYAVRGMVAFEPLLASRVTEPGEAAGLVGKLGPGLGAFTIRVDAASALTGLQPEDKVDVYWTGTPPNADGDVTRLIEAAVQIIAVDEEQMMEGQEGLPRINAVTVAGNRDQVARLAQAQATGRLALSVVRQNAANAEGLVEVTGNSLLGILPQQEEEIVQAPAEKVCTIRTRKAGDTVEVPIPCTN
jgi:pilus assembly protein CpaB